MIEELNIFITEEITQTRYHQINFVSRILNLNRLLIFLTYCRLIFLSESLTFIRPIRIATYVKKDRQSKEGALVG